MVAIVPIEWPPELDDKCRQLVALFIIEHREYRFNEFVDLVEKSGIKISKPTLIEHLNHLVDLGLVHRNEVTKQNVTYRFHWENWQGVEERIKAGIIANQLIEK